MTITKTLTAATLAAALMTGTAAFASDGVMLSDATRAQITEKLTADGYEVRKIKTEDGLYEAYALKDGKKYEIYLDAELNVVKGRDSDD